MEYEEKYYLISSGEDGINIIELENANEVQKFFDENLNPDEVITQPVFLDKIPDIDKGYFWFGQRNKFKENEVPMVLIKGKVIVPEPIKVVKKYKFE